MTTALHPIQLELSTLKRTWVDVSQASVLELAASRDSFTSDDLHLILPEPMEPNWYGVLLASLKNSGRIERVGYVQSTRPERNGGVVAQWKLKPLC